ncbi:helix-turn-helix transcriptional regulator [Polymorphospora rubra]|uniref:helix-turn-helix domain-containing protein n=1 Tax=Polymorphospora rubra TaxID=338584 RepID=UPI0033FAC68B
MDGSANAPATPPIEAIGAVARFRARNGLGFLYVSTTWGPEAAAQFRAYVLQSAANTRPDIQTVADLSRATDIKPGVLSKWFRGVEQPSVRLLEAIAPIIGAPLSDLLVLTGRVRPEALGLEAAPVPPGIIGHPLAREIDTLLGDDSHLSQADRSAMADFLARWLEPYRRPARRTA